jgi:hypothetical protein
MDAEPPKKCFAFFVWMNQVDVMAFRKTTSISFISFIIIFFKHRDLSIVSVCPET